MRFQIFLILSFFVLSCSVKEADIDKYKSYPRYETVIQEFSRNYSFPELPESNTFYRFIKTKNGYEVLGFGYEGNDIEEKEKYLFWSLEGTRFVDPGTKFHKKLSEAAIEKMCISESRNSYNYDRMIYYGYKNYEKDIIDELEGAGNLTDTLMESLARAYGSEALKIPSKIFNSKKNGVPSEEETKNFCELLNKEAEQYREIMKINPDYQCLVGRVDAKHAHQMMHGFYQMDMWDKKTESEKFLEQAEYGVLIENYAKNVLSSCEKNAILFTNGDTDTYPLWYMQEKKGLRKDVAIVNTSLLNLPEYIDYVRSKYGLKMALSNDDYENPLTDAVFLQTDSPHFHKADSILKAMNGNLGSFKTFDSNNGKKYLTITFHRFSIPVEKDKYVQDSSLILTDMILLQKNTLLKGELAELDIISSNFSERPVYYSGERITTGWDKSFLNWIESHGIVSKITPYMEKISTHSQRMNYAKQKNLLMNVYHISAPAENSFEAEAILASYVFLFVSTAEKAVELESEDEAMRIIRKCEKVIPVGKLSSYHPDISFAVFYYRFPSQKKKANACMERAIGKMEKEFAKNKIGRQYLLSLCNLVITTLSNHEGDPALIKRCEKLRDKAGFEKFY